MVDFLRRPEKFVSTDGTLTYTFPGDDMAYSANQPYRAALAAAVGADYAHDFLLGAAWPRDVGEELVRFTIWADTAAAADSEYDSCASTLRRIGAGKLYLLDAAGARRWCWAKARNRPSYVVDVDQYYNMPCECSFVRLSDWFATAATTGSQALSASPTDFTIANPGNARVRNLVLRLRANAAGGIIDPTIANQTNGQSVATTRDSASVNSEIRYDSERFKVEYSNDDGGTYANDYTLVTLGATQAALMELEVGNNSMRYTQASGTPNAVIEWSFYAAYE